MRLVAAMPGFIDEVLDRAQETLDLRAIVQRRIESHDISALEGIERDIAARELEPTGVLGGVLGFLVGLAQAGPLSLVGGGR